MTWETYANFQWSRRNGEPYCSTDLVPTSVFWDLDDAGRSIYLCRCHCDPVITKDMADSIRNHRAAKEREHGISKSG
jgi:hypothetical protein